MSTARHFLAGQVIIVGYGAIGSTIANALKVDGIPVVIAEQNRELVEFLRAKGFAAVYGNAAEPAVLIQAHVADAAILVITANDPIDIQKMVETAKTLNPDIEVLIDAEDPDDYQILQQARLGQVFFSDDIVASAITAAITEHFSEKSEQLT